MIVGSVILHWFTQVVGEEEVPDGFRWAVQWLFVFFYADHDLLALPRPDWIQAALDALTFIFQKGGTLYQHQ